MSKSAIYTVNNTTQVVAVDGQINLGSVIRRFGCNCHLNNNAINITGSGYYDIDASFTIAPTADGEVTVTMYKDGIAVPGAVATETVAAAGDSANLSISSLVREFCPCCDNSSNLTFVLSGVESNVTNVAIVVEKL